MAGRITLRVQTPEGTKRLEIEADASAKQLFESIYYLFELNSYCFAVYRQRNQKDEITSTRDKTIASLGIKHGDMLYVTAVNGATVFPVTPMEIPPSPKSSNASVYSKPGTSKELEVEPVPSTSSGITTSSKSSASNTSYRLPAPYNITDVKEDEVDLQLYKIDGKVKRPRDEKLCRHSAKGCCVHCSPLEPYDEQYLKTKEIKHLSFHSYLRKAMSGASGAKFIAGALADIQCRIKEGCKDHPPWPKAICSKCTPSAITLNQQTYRHVDNIMFENAALVERFLNYWRTTGHQRVGFLYGNYEIHSDVPLGIRARVAAIYEPPQESTRDLISLLEDNRKDVVDQIASELGLRCVGWIFTDLIAENMQKGTVKHLRGADTHFLSAQECINAATFQNQHPNPCRFASSGNFGSKFVTVCVTGDKTNQVHMEGYAVSAQCMALVRDDCLIPTKDASELGYVRESNDKQYVPDVYYKEKDVYGNEVSRLARPLPVEYLLVDIPASTPLTPQYTFNYDPSKVGFPVENRLLDGHIQDFNALSNYLAQFTPDQFLTTMSDFHLLLYIATMDMLPMKDLMSPLLAAVRDKNAPLANEWAHSDHWATVEQLIAASSPPSSRSTSISDHINTYSTSNNVAEFASSLASDALHHAQSLPNAAGPFRGFMTSSSSANQLSSLAQHVNDLATGGTSTSGGSTHSIGSSNASSNAAPAELWTCAHCTYLNHPVFISCEMCNLPRRND